MKPLCSALRNLKAWNPDPLWGPSSPGSWDLTSLTVIYIQVVGWWFFFPQSQLWFHQCISKENVNCSYILLTSQWRTSTRMCDRAGRELHLLWPWQKPLAALVKCWLHPCTDTWVVLSHWSTGGSQRQGGGGFFVKCFQELCPADSVFQPGTAAQNYKDIDETIDLLPFSREDLAWSVAAWIRKCVLDSME